MPEPLDLDQLRAEAAFSRAAAIRSGQGRTERAAFLRLARRLPAMLQTNGVLASWAFLAKSGEGRPLVRESLETHLGSEQLGFAEPLRKMGSLFSSQLAHRTLSAGDRLDPAELRRLTAELITFSSWLKRAAEALCDEGQEVEP